MGCSRCPSTLMTSCASCPPRKAVTGANSAPMFWRKQRRNSLRRVSGGRSSSLCFSVANFVKSSRSARDSEGGFVETPSNSHKARRQVKRGEIRILRRRVERCSWGIGDLLATSMGEYISRLVTISVNLPCSFFVRASIIERVAVSSFRSVGTFDLSRSMIYS